MNKIKKVLLSVLGAGLLACSSHVKIIATDEVVRIDGEQKDLILDSLISIYRDSLKGEMDEIIAFTKIDLTVIRKPSGTLSNWAADALLSEETKNVRLSIPAVAILNTGGLRSSLNKGELTVGDFYKLMPFDNEVVWVKLPSSALAEIVDYYHSKGGDPISNAIIDDNGLVFSSQVKEVKEFWVITSDYLMNGGDHMNFFKNATEKVLTGRFLRDVFIDAAIAQDTLIVNTENRMNF